LIRDDGSTDATVERAEALRDSRISIIRGTNVGFARSFLALLDAAPTDADMYMLADQDDIWLPVRIDRAARFISRVSAAMPALYCSRVRLVDADLNEVGLSDKRQEHPKFQGALCENIVVGCTAAFNRAALL